MHTDYRPRSTSTSTQEPLPILTYELFPPCLNLTRRKRSVGGSVFNFTAVESHAGALTAKEGYPFARIDRDQIWLLGGIQVQKKYRDFKDYFLRMLMRCTYVNGCRARERGG
eukprot:1383545-Amorphochlora_amoeboformis.AAC.1